MNEPVADPLVGQLLAARYRVLRKLGEGAMGAVYLAEHVRMGRRDAIKVLRDTLASDREAIARFERGARNVSAIRHTNVCTIYDFTETEDGLRFLAMEYVDGPTLKDLLEQEGMLPLERAVEIACQAAAGLDAAHDAGIVHRDLKPGNIMLVRGKGGRDVVKVVDFDIAKGPEGGEEVTRLGFVIGTPEYMSPEQLMGERLDGRSDVYSLALVLVRMLTGLLPFRAEGTQDLMIARLTSSPLPLSELRPELNVPPALQQVLDRALQRKADDRQADAVQFAAELRAALGGRPAPASAAAAPPTRPSRPPAGSDAGMPGTRIEPALPGTDGPSGFRKYLVPVGGVVALLTIAVVAWALTGGGDESNGAMNAIPVAVPPIAGSDGGTTGDDTEQTGGTVLTDGGSTATDRTDPTPPPAPPPAPPPTPPPSSLPAEGIRFAGATSIDDALQRMSDRVLGAEEPRPSELPAIRDTLMAAWEQATTDGQRRTAATTLAWVASFRSDAGECRRWADEVSRLGGDANRLRTLCAMQEP